MSQQAGNTDTLTSSGVHGLAQQTACIIITKGIDNVLAGGGKQVLCCIAIARRDDNAAPAQAWEQCAT